MMNAMALSRRNPILKGCCVLLLILVPFVCILLCDQLQITDNEQPVRALLRFFLLFLFACAFLAAWRQKLHAETVLRFLLLAGILLRIGYMLYTNWTVRAYDVGFLDETGVGHGSYILNNILQGHLPASNEYQFYHPPLYHILSAISIKLASILKGTTDYASLIKYAMAVSCTASCVTLLYCQKLADALHIEKRYQLIAVGILAFFPNLFLMGGRVNNDGLVTMFMVMAVYYTVRWYYEPRAKWIVGIALSIGLGMMTKISCGTVALFTGPIMLYHLWLAWREKRVLPVIGQLALFAAICFPLALWYPIRNYVLFSQPLNYVHDLGTGSHVYTGDVSWVKRFFSVPITEIFETPYMHSSDDYSIFMIITRTAIFGEFQYDDTASQLVSTLLYFANLLLIFASLAAMVFVCVREKHTKDRFAAYAMAVLWAITFVSFIIFNITYPFSCTADVRYIPLAGIAGCLYLSKAYGLCRGGQMLPENKTATHAKSPAHRRLASACAGLVIVFSSLVLAMFA